MVVPGGGISLDGQRWASARPAFLLAVRVLLSVLRWAHAHHRNFPTGDATTRTATLASPNPEDRVVTRHGQPYANTEAAPLQVIFKLALTFELPAPAASGAPVSISGNSRNSPIVVPETEINAPPRDAGGKINPPGATTKPTAFDKTP